MFEMLQGLMVEQRLKAISMKAIRFLNAGTERTRSSNNVYLLLAVSTCVWVSGCVSPPRLGPDLRAKGGHPRVRALLQFIVAQHRSHSTSQSKEPGWVSYAGVIGPSINTQFDFGELPGIEEHACHSSYILVSSVDTIEDTDHAVVTKTVHAPEGIQSYTGYRLRWNRAKCEWYLTSWATCPRDRLKAEEDFAS
jgi:hypothetical protein